MSSSFDPEFNLGMELPFLTPRGESVGVQEGEADKICPYFVSWKPDLILMQYRSIKGIRELFCTGKGFFSGLNGNARVFLYLQNISETESYILNFVKKLPYKSGYL